MSVTKDTQLELHRMMMLIRLFEEALEEMFSRGLLHGTMHLSIGQEAPAAVASCPIERCIVPCRRPRENISSNASSNNLINIIIR